MNNNRTQFIKLALVCVICITIISVAVLIVQSF